MKARKVVVTLELETEMSIRDLKNDIRKGIELDCWQTSVKQIQINVIKQEKEG